MYQLVDNERINIVDEFNAGTHYAFLNNIQATYANGVLTASYNFPTIEGTEWQGAINTTETRPLKLSISNEIGESTEIELTVTNGQVTREIQFNQTGLYKINLKADFPCEYKMLEVTI